MPNTFIPNSCYRKKNKLKHDNWKYNREKVAIFKMEKKGKADVVVLKIVSQNSTEEFRCLTNYFIHLNNRCCWHNGVPLSISVFFN